MSSRVWIITTSCCCEHGDIDSVWPTEELAEERRKAILAGPRNGAIRGYLHFDLQRRQDQVQIEDWEYGVLAEDMV